MKRAEVEGMVNLVAPDHSDDAGVGDLLPTIGELEKPLSQEVYTTIQVWHTKVMAALLRGMTSNREIAGFVGISSKSVAVIRNSPSFIRQFEHIRDMALGKEVDRARQFEVLADKAGQVLDYHLERDPTNLSVGEQRLQIQVAESTLDREGKAIKKTGVEIKEERVTKEVLVEMKARLEGKIERREEKFENPLERLIDGLAE